MSHWLFRANPDDFRIHDFIHDYNFVEFFQGNFKIEVGDIVYLYITGKAKRIEYKMVVTKKDITLKESFNDRAYSLLNPLKTYLDTDKFVRFEKISRVETDELCYKKICEHGFVGANGRILPMTSNRLLKEETINYIENFFKK